MTSLTDNYYSVNNPFNPNNNNNNNNNPKKEWFDVVYLCIEKQNDLNLNGRFYCYSFNSFEKANNFKNMKLSLKPNLKATLIPMCKWVPMLMHKYFLNYKLKKIFWKNDIIIMKHKI